MTVPAEFPGTNLISISMLPNKNDLFDLTAEPEKNMQHYNVIGLNNVFEFNICVFALAKRVI